MYVHKYLNFDKIYDKTPSADEVVELASSDTDVNGGQDVPSSFSTSSSFSDSSSVTSSDDTTGLTVSSPPMASTLAVTYSSSSSLLGIEGSTILEAMVSSSTLESTAAVLSTLSELSLSTVAPFGSTFDSSTTSTAESLLGSTAACSEAGALTLSSAKVSVLGSTPETSPSSTTLESGSLEKVLVSGSTVDSTSLKPDPSAVLTDSPTLVAVISPTSTWPLIYSSTVSSSTFVSSVFPFLSVVITVSLFALLASSVSPDMAEEASV